MYENCHKLSGWDLALKYSFTQCPFGCRLCQACVQLAHWGREPERWQNMQSMHHKANIRRSHLVPSHLEGKSAPSLSITISAHGVKSMPIDRFLFPLFCFFVLHPFQPRWDSSYCSIRELVNSVPILTCARLQAFPLHMGKHLNPAGLITCSGNMTWCFFCSQPWGGAPYGCGWSNHFAVLTTPV